MENCTIPYIENIDDVENERIEINLEMENEENNNNIYKYRFLMLLFINIILSILLIITNDILFIFYIPLIIVFSSYLFNEELAKNIPIINFVIMNTLSILIYSIFVLLVYKKKYNFIIYLLLCVTNMIGLITYHNYKLLLENVAI